MMNHPFLVLAFSFCLLWLSTRLGILMRGERRDLPEDSRDDLGLIMTASLTLLGLLIGFSFSMATTRYDLRKSYEESEANAIGTEYVRADLLPVANSARVRSLLRQYLDQRVLFYESTDRSQLSRVNSNTAALQSQLWSASISSATAQPTPIEALAVSGMNDVLNSQGYTQSAWWNRIPAAAWGLMFAIAICCNVLVGFGMRRAKNEALLLLVFPLIVSISFFLIAEIDSPRGGIIRVSPQNLVSLSQSLQTD